MEKYKCKAHIISTHILCFFLVTVLLTLTLTLFWTMRIWKTITFSEIAYYLTSNIEGTNSDVINSFFMQNLLPSVIIAAVWAILRIVWIRYGHNAKLFTAATFVLVSVLFVCSLIIFTIKYRVIDYIKNCGENSDFVEQVYVDPEQTIITFPEKKRNIIYIFLESMEMTYADQNDGGAFESNCIPGLTALAESNECFSDSNESLNGASTVYGCTYTMGGMVAQTSGLPIFSGVGNAMGTKTEFYPGVTAIGDILEDNGYNQELMIGSPAEFGGRNQYFKEHGNYKIFDYDYAIANGYIPEDYSVWWGYEDEKLFCFAKEEITNLASEDEPFNFTMLTADTHFEDGYCCELCKDEFDSQYANVMACSSQQVCEFVTWIKEQSFYEDTTVVICGDHLTMDSDFCDDVDSDYQRRTYVSIINSAADLEDDDNARQYTTLDMFPTTLAAMGCDIDGNRLALGVNLYSSSPTLLEQYGINYLNEELSKSSEFVNENIASIDSFDTDIIAAGNLLNLVISPSIYNSDGKVELSLSGLENIESAIQCVYVEIYDENGNLVDTMEMERYPDLTYNALIDSYKYRDSEDYIMRFFVTDESDEKHFVYSYTCRLGNDFCCCHSDINAYLRLLRQTKDIVIFGAVKDDAAVSLGTSTINYMHLLGFKAKFAGSYRSVWVGTNCNQYSEQIGTAEECVSFGGHLEDGTKYSLVSSGYDRDNYCSIAIDGVEYAVCERGINLVIYDTRKGRVVDSVAFDTYGSYMTCDEQPGYLINSIHGETIDICLTDLKRNMNVSNISEVYAYIWDKDTEGCPTKVSLSVDSNFNFMYTGSIVDMDRQSMYISVYIRANGGCVIWREIQRVNYGN